MKAVNANSLWTLLWPIAVSALLVACQPIQPVPAETAAEESPTATSQQEVVKPTDAVEVQIENAKSAAPEVVSQDATILGFPVEEGGDMVVLQEGSNGWTCFTDWPASPGNDPACYDPIFSAWNDAFATGAEPEITAPGIAYMLLGGSDPSNTDPMAMEPIAGEEWISTPPHIMLILPDGFDPAMFTTDHHSGYSYIMWEGTPYEHIMIPVVPATTASTEPLTADATPEEQIENMMSAAPAVIVNDATLMGFPSEEGGEMQVLQEGTNGWVCYPDRLVSPGNDPSCNDAMMEEGFATATTRNVPHAGLSYMLAGGSDESNTDPLATGPAEGEEWIATPPHVMIMVPGGFDVNEFTTDYSSGYPYIMWDDTDYEHLMIPIADMHAAHDVGN